MLEDLKKDAATRMVKCVQNFQADLKKLRTGRAHPSLIEHLKVDYYGSEVPLQQVASIAVEEGRTLISSPWEKASVQAIEKAIFKSDLGLTPMTAGTVIRIPMPALTAERRREITKGPAHDAGDGLVGPPLSSSSSAKWGRPAQEVGSPVGLFLEALEGALEELHAKGVRLRFIGARRDLPVRLHARFAPAEARTAGNGGLKLHVAL